LSTLTIGGLNANTLIEIKNFKNVNGFIVLEANLNGEVGNYILDTGASDLYINKNIEKGDILIDGVDRSYKASTTLISNFSIGKISIENINAYVLNLKDIEYLINMPLNGLIGGNMLLDYAVLIDYKNENITFYKTLTAISNIKCTEYHIYSTPFMLEGSLPIISVNINGVTGDFGIDTGATLNLIDEAFVSNAKLEIDKISLGAITIDNFNYTPSSLSSSDFNISQSIEGILSPEILNVNKLLIDYSRNRITFFWNK
jgi:hypothetical protein